MLRKDREITDRDERMEILRRCDTLTIGFHGAEFPYLVPVSFGIKRIIKERGLKSCGGKSQQNGLSYHQQLQDQPIWRN